MTLRAMNEVAAAIAPCAKLTIRVERQISTRARAKAAKTAPWINPLRVTFTNWCTRGTPSWLPGRGDGSEAEIGVPQGLVGHQRAGRVGDDDPAQVEDDADVGDGQGAAGVLLDQQHRETLRVDELAEQPEDLGHDPRREAEGGLVEQQDPWLGQQCAADDQ